MNQVKNKGHFKRNHTKAIGSNQLIGGQTINNEIVVIIRNTYLVDIRNIKSMIANEMALMF
jgi:hypothetical protein